MRRKKESEYHTGRLNISCPPSIKDAIAADATEHDQSISQFILELYSKSKQAGTSEHLAHMGLDLVGIKKRLVDIDARLRRVLAKNQGSIDRSLVDEVARLHELESEIDVVLRETVATVKQMKDQGK